MRPSRRQAQDAIKNFRTESLTYWVKLYKTLIQTANEPNSKANKTL